MLEDVKLKEDAFDYLQLPFAVRRGTFGRVEIQVVVLFHVTMRCIQVFRNRNLAKAAAVLLLILGLRCWVFVCYRTCLQHERPDRQH